MKEPLAEVRCEKCGRDDGLKINDKDEVNPYLVCSCGAQPSLREAQEAFKRSPEDELLAAIKHNGAWSYNRGSPNPHHHAADRALSSRLRMATKRVTEEIERLREELHEATYDDRSDLYD